MSTEQLNSVVNQWTKDKTITFTDLARIYNFALGHSDIIEIDKDALTTTMISKIEKTHRSMNIRFMEEKQLPMIAKLLTSNPNIQYFKMVIESLLLNDPYEILHSLDLTLTLNQNMPNGSFNSEQIKCLQEVYLQYCNSIIAQLDPEDVCKTTSTFKELAAFIKKVSPSPLLETNGHLVEKGHLFINQYIDKPFPIDYRWGNTKEQLKKDIQYVHDNLPNKIERSEAIEIFIGQIDSGGEKRISSITFKD